MHLRISESKGDMSSKEGKRKPSPKVSFAGDLRVMKTKESHQRMMKDSVADLVSSMRRKSSKDGSILTFVEPTAKRKSKKTEQPNMQQELMSLVTMLKHKSDIPRASKLVGADVVEIVEETNSL